MSIQWYPGHMTKARRLIAEAIPGKDVLIEVVDGRMPRASRNPIFAELGAAKPLLLVLSKSDLADPDVTDAWLQFFEKNAARRQAPVAAVAINTASRGELRRLIPRLCAGIAARRIGPDRPLRAVVVGVPTVGKSSLLNALQGRKVAAVADRPGVTRAEQKVVLADGSVLSDVPGLLWPNIEDPAVGLALAFGGVIPDTAIDLETVALFGAEILRKRYPQRLVEHLQLDPLPETADAILDAVGRRRGCLKSGGVVDRNKAAGHLIHAFRSGALGRISLEAPPGSSTPSLPAEGEELAEPLLPEDG
jgi:ribosome biogenesis GTPase A